MLALKRIDVLVHFGLAIELSCGLVIVLTEVLVTLLATVLVTVLVRCGLVVLPDELVCVQKPGPGQPAACEQNFSSCVCRWRTFFTHTHETKKTLARMRGLQLWFIAVKVFEPNTLPTRYQHASVRAVLCLLVALL
jgi:hypothetical protein